MGGYTCKAMMPVIRIILIKSNPFLIDWFINLLQNIPCKEIQNVTKINTKK